MPLVAPLNPDPEGTRFSPGPQEVIGNRITIHLDERKITLHHHPFPQKICRKDKPQPPPSSLKHAPKGPSKKPLESTDGLKKKGQGGNPIKEEGARLESKQYLTTHTIDNAHETDIFSIAVTPKQIVSASGASYLIFHSTAEPEHPVAQTLDGAHGLGCHHLAASENGEVIASAGFSGEVLLWKHDNDRWTEMGKILDGNKTGEIWAIALSSDGRYLAATSVDGRINVWDNLGDRTKIREYETKGSFGMSIDLVSPGMLNPILTSTGLAKAVRAVAFSPGSKLLAAAGDAKLIGLYDVSSGEQVANLSGHAAWIFSLDWNDTGEYLLSG
ncbi:MAG: hypothetical protein LQ351_004799 [Letrouitia transgressa]|nr:MAG: hypothetical protein LQ351_004799 [Letrouitia transgressa]